MFPNVRVVLGMQVGVAPLPAHIHPLPSSDNLTSEVSEVQCQGLVMHWPPDSQLIEWLCAPAGSSLLSLLY